MIEIYHSKLERDAYRRGHLDGYRAGRQVRYRILRAEERTPNPLQELVSDLHELVAMWVNEERRAKAAIPDRLAINDHLKAYELAEHADRLMLSATYLVGVLKRHDVHRPAADGEPDRFPAE